MFTSIVVGTDGSGSAREAVRQAGEMAKAFGATLHIVCAFKSGAMIQALAVDPIMSAGGVAYDAEQDLATQAEGIASASAHDVAKDVNVETYTIAGEPADAILDLAETQKADLIIVGNKGMTGAKRFLLGSVPNKVAHQAPCSVLIVHTT
ncbi:MAG: universal stress protein [Actinomycetota bacterium]|nr:universal stress protein [Actinomycetota bacterium]